MKFNSVTKLGSTCWGVARWSIGFADQVTRNDQYDQQCYDRGDDSIRWYSRGDNGIWWYLRGDDGI